MTALSSRFTQALCQPTPPPQARRIRPVPCHRQYWPAFQDQGHRVPKLPQMRPEQTKYYLSNLPSETTVRRHHSLNGQKLALLFVVRLPDGSSLKILRRWTDIDGPDCVDLSGKALSVQGLKELLSLFMALRERTGEKTVR